MVFTNSKNLFNLYLWVLSHFYENNNYPYWRIGIVHQKVNFINKKTPKNTKG